MIWVVPVSIATLKWFYSVSVPTVCLLAMMNVEYENDDVCFVSSTRYPSIWVTAIVVQPQVEGD